MFNNARGSLVPERGVSSIRRAVDITVTAAPDAGVMVIGPAVTSKDTTRSAGASPTFTCTAELEAGGGLPPPGLEAGAELEPPPPQAVAISISRTARNSAGSAVEELGG